MLFRNYKSLMYKRVGVGRGRGGDLQLHHPDSSFMYNIRLNQSQLLSLIMMPSMHPSSEANAPLKGHHMLLIQPKTTESHYRIFFNTMQHNMNHIYVAFLGVPNSSMSQIQNSSIVTNRHLSLHMLIKN